jgi:hypothetical protein
LSQAQICDVTRVASVYDTTGMTRQNAAKASLDVLPGELRPVLFTTADNACRLCLGSH